MAETTPAGQVAKEMKIYGIEVQGISETKWKGSGSVTLRSGEKVVYVGTDEVQQGRVAMMSARTKGVLMEWTAVSKMIITTRFYSKHKKLTAVQAYAPTNGAMGEERDEF